MTRLLKTVLLALFSILVSSISIKFIYFFNLHTNRSETSSAVMTVLTIAIIMALSCFFSLLYDKLFRK